MRLITTTLICLFAFLAYFTAESSPNRQPGMYLGVTTGYGNSNYSNDTLIDPSVAELRKTGGFSNQVIIGYRISPSLALELSAIYFTQRPTYEILDTGQQFKIKNTIVSLTPKYSIPFAGNFYWNLVAGVGYVVRDGVVKQVKLFPSGEFFRPVYGMDLEYALNDKCSLITDWRQTPADNPQRLPTSNFFGAGFVISF